MPYHSPFGDDLTLNLRSYLDDGQYIWQKLFMGLCAYRFIIGEAYIYSKTAFEDGENWRKKLADAPAAALTTLH